MGLLFRRKYNKDITIKKIIEYLFLFGLLPHTVYAQSLNFGEYWEYHIIGCDYESMGQFSFIPKGNKVYGSWSEGSPQGQGTSGKLKGEIKNNKLLIWRCSDDGNSLYPECPSYEKEPTRYFIKNQNFLSSYSKYGDKFQEDFTKFHKVKKGIEIPTQKEKCRN